MFVTNRRKAMTTKAGVGMSHYHSPSIAGHEAAKQALENAGLEKPDFVFMFASVGYDQRSLLQAVREATGGAPLSGCSGEGTISGDDADESNFSVVVMAISSDDLRWHNGLATGLGADSRTTGQQVAQSLSSDLSTDAVGLFVFPDGTTVNFDHFFAGLEGELSSDQFLPLWGGGAGDNFAMVQTYQYCDDEVVSDGVAYALLSGEAHLASTIGIGYIPIGGERKVTRSQGNVIYEIDGKPALEVLQEYLPDRVLTEDWGRYIPTFGLSFRAPSHMEDEEYILRGINSVNTADGSVSLQTDVQEDTSVWFSSRDKEKIITGLDRMADRIKEELGGAQPKLVLHFDCCSRGKIMLRDQEKLQIFRRFRQAVGPEVPWAGFYTYGEIGPVGKHNYYHAYTAVVLALS
jgi:hypothetical protein